MTSRDVDQLVSEMMEKIHRIRPSLPQLTREVQTQILRNIALKQPIFRTFEEPTSAHKRGFLLEAVVKAHPSYEGTKMSSEERLIADALLEFIWVYTRPFPRYRQYGFKLPDDVVVVLKDGRNKRKREAIVQQIIEIKHEGSAKDARKQLQQKVDDLMLGAQILDRFVPPMQAEYGPSLGLRSLEESSWPRKVLHVEIPSEIEKILYLPDGAEIGDVNGWEKRYACFNKREIQELARFYWEQLVVVEKEEATTEEVGMAIRRAPSVSVRQGVLDVREHEVQQESEMAQPKAQSVERRDGKGLTYYYINDVAAEWPDIQEDLERRVQMTLREASHVVTDVKNRCPEWDSESAQEKVHENLRHVAANLQHIPSKALIARYELDEARSRIQLAGTRVLLERVKEDPKGKQHPKEKIYEQILADRERKLEGREEEPETYEAAPEEEGITHNGSLFQAVVNVFDEVFGDVARARNLEKLKELGVPVDTVDEVLAGAQGAADSGRAQAQEGGGMRQCPSCSAINSAERKRCNECGAPLEKPQEQEGPRICPSCQTAAKEGDKRCNECGAELPPERQPAASSDNQGDGGQTKDTPSADAVAAAAAAVAPSPTPQPAAQTTQQSDESRFCTECGAQNVESAKFCNSCGHAMPAAQ